MKVAVLGIGRVATANYLPVLSKRPGVELALHNRTVDKAQKAADRYGCIVLETIDELASWSPDMVFVLTSETVRYEVGMAAVAAAPQLTFFEKPLCAAKGQAHVSEDDFADGKRLIEAAHAQGCKTAMMFNYRFFLQSIRARELATERDFGRLISSSGLVHYACWSHCIDLVSYFGGPLATVSAVQGPCVRTARAIAAPDISVSFISVSEACGTLVATAGLAWNHPLFELTLVFERGRVHMRGLDGELEITDSSREHIERFVPSRETSRWQSYSASFERALTALFDCCDEGVDPPVPGIDGLRELQVEASIQRSIRERRPVSVQEEFPL